MIEDKLKYLLRNHKADLDIEKLWSELEPHVPIQKKKRKVIPFFFFAATFALVGYLYLSNYQKQIQISEKVPNEALPKEVHSDLIEKHEVVKADEKESSKIIYSGLPTSLKNKMILTNENESIRQDTLSSYSLEKTTFIHPSAAYENFSSSLEPLTVPDPADLTLVESTHPPVGFISSHESNDEARGRDMVLSLDPLKIGNLQNERKEAVIVQQPIELSHSTHKWSIFLSSGIGVSKTKFISKNQEQEGIYSEVLENVSDKISLAFDVGIAYQLSSHLEILTGIKLHHITNSYNVSWQKLSYFNGQGVSAIDIDNEGNFVERQGMIVTTKNDSYKGIHYEYNNYVDLPLILSKQWNLSKQFSLYTNVGLEMNLFEMHSGSVLNNDLIFESISKSNSPYNKSNNRISYLLGSGINFNIHNFPLSLGIDYIGRKSGYQIDVEEYSKLSSMLLFTCRTSFKI